MTTRRCSANLPALLYSGSPHPSDIAVFLCPFFAHALGRVDRRKYNTSGEYRQPSVTVVETRRPQSWRLQLNYRSLSCAIPLPNNACSPSSTTSATSNTCAAPITTSPPCSIPPTTCRRKTPPCCCITSMTAWNAAWTN
nr:MAG TPA: hypothetical protein [Caudoviricetes sp.]